VRRQAAFLSLVALLVAALAQTALAHPLGFSGLRVFVHPESIHASLTVHTRDMGRWFPPGRFPDYVPQVCAAMKAAPGEILEISFDDGQAATPFDVKATQIEVGLLEFEIEVPRPAGARRVQVWSKHLPMLPPGHQQLLAAQVNGEALFDDTLTTEHDASVFDLPNVTAATTQATSAPAEPLPPPRRISFFLLGIEHIVTGYDHLLFLAALLLVCRTFKQAVAVITFFTVAHSITLSLASLGIVRAPGEIVEPAIAASIVYVGLENIFGKHRFIWRAGITFLFGLLHGLGFASALSEVGFGSTAVGIAMPLLKFSIGLETGQLAIAAVMLAILMKLRTWPTYDKRWMPAGSIVVSLIGLYWLVTRVMSG
jgi:hydrogenase/urease accessory protein HupE